MKLYQSIIIIPILVILLVVGLFAFTHSQKPLDVTSPIEKCDICQKVLPEAESFIKENFPPHYKAFQTNPATKEKEICGYVFQTGDLAPNIKGFVGPINILIGINTEGTITGIELISQNETPEYVGPSIPSFIKKFISKNIESPLKLGQDIDGISHATITSQAIVDAIKKSLDVMNPIIKRQNNIINETINVNPEPGIDVSAVKRRIEKSGLTPQEAKYWKSLGETP